MQTPTVLANPRFRSRALTAFHPDMAGSSPFKVPWEIDDIHTILLHGGTAILYSRSAPSVSITRSCQGIEISRMQSFALEASEARSWEGIIRKSRTAKPPLPDVPMSGRYI